MFRVSSCLNNRLWRTIPNLRSFAAASESVNPLDKRLKDVRNIGISAHIDSGKTTLTERILFYCGRIKEIHEVRGKDGVGAKMDSMELEREKGITIQAAATYVQWKNKQINIIDTPGHVDFTIEVERALRVLDSAIMVVCGVSGVQSQTITVDRQMKRYNVPRVIFINKCDRQGANPDRAAKQLREKLKLNAWQVQIPIGVEAEHKGLVDIITRKAVFNIGDKGEEIRYEDCPARLVDAMELARKELIHALAELDESLAEKMIMEGEGSISEDEINASIRNFTIQRKFIPIFLGSAMKNKGVQSLLDGVTSYLPNPTEVHYEGINLDKNENVPLLANSTSPLVALAFKLQESRFGQLTYMRIYQGSLKRGDPIINLLTGQKMKVPRLVRMHSDEMEDIQEIGAGDICAMFGIDCSSGTTFVSPETGKIAMNSMFVPEPVMSLSLTPKDKKMLGSVQFGRALNRFQREDPTFRVSTDAESGQTIISGMGELHLEIYVERMKREYGIECITGQPRVAYRETILKKTNFEYLHRKQSGGSGQYAKVMGFIEPLNSEEIGVGPESLKFDNETVGGSIPPQYISACEKGFRDAGEKGPLIGHPLAAMRLVVNDGDSHSVDSSEMAFRTCTAIATKQAIKTGSPAILEPIMKVTVSAPVEFQGGIIAGLTRRRGVVVNTETQDTYVVVEAQVALASMFGYSTELRSNTEGKGEFSMEYFKHTIAPREDTLKLISEYEKKIAEGSATRR